MMIGSADNQHHTCAYPNPPHPKPTPKSTPDLNPKPNPAWNHDPNPDRKASVMRAADSASQHAYVTDELIMSYTGQNKTETTREEATSHPYPYPYPCFCPYPCLCPCPYPCFCPYPCP